MWNKFCDIDKIQILVTMYLFLFTIYLKYENICIQIRKSFPKIHNKTSLKVNDKTHNDYYKLL